MKVTKRTGFSSLAPTPQIVYITGIAGIVEVFAALKLKLSENSTHYLSIVYSVSCQDTPALFEAELENLQKRFPKQLQVHYITNTKPFLEDNLDEYQRFLEVEINCNTSEELQFIVFGDNELIELISSRLLFLGISASQISSQII